MVSTDCLASVDICALRVAGLTATGVPRPGAFGYYTNQVETAKIGTTNDTINQVLRRNGCGTIVTSIAQQVSVSGSQISIDLTKWERDLIQLLVGGLAMVSSGHTGAYRAPYLSDGPPNPVCIELWSKAWDTSTQAVTAISTPNGSYHHWVLPFVQCDLSSQFTLANGDTIFTITGTGSENPVITADGPWNDWPSWVAGHGGFTSSFGEYDDGTIPTAACGLQTVPATS